MPTNLSAQEWDAFVVASPQASFLQSWAWGQMQEKLHVPFWRLALEESGTLAGVILVLKRTLPWSQNWLYVPRGPIFSTAMPSESVWQQAQEKLIALAKQEGSLFVRLDPGLPVSAHKFLTQHGWRKANRDVQPRHTLVLDLTPSEAELLAAMHQKTRYNIRLAEKKGVTVRFSRDAADLEHFLELSAYVQGRSAFRYHPPEYYRAMHATLTAAGQFEIGIAERDSAVLAAHILVTYAGTTTYVHGASSSAQRELMAPHLLQWATIQRAKAAGSTLYDFFGITADDAPADHPWTGITRFKTGFGGRRVAYVGAYDYVFDPARYTTLQLARRIRGLFR